MADVHDRETRSFNMSQIRAKNTKPEILVRKFLFARGYRYRIHDKRLPGKPDIVLPKHRLTISVNGCFWHGHSGCQYFVVPKTRTDWWVAKIRRNKELDRKNSRLLKKEGWRTITIYECELKPKAIDKTFKRILKSL